MKNKLLSPKELDQFRLQQEEQRKLRAAELKIKILQEENKNKILISPKELLDPKPKQTVKVVEEPIVIEESVVVEDPKDPIEILCERLEEVASTIKEPKYYDEELANLEVLIANKVDLGEIDLEPINLKIQELREYISEIPEVKYYDEDLNKLTGRVDQLQISGAEILQEHGENLKEIEKVIHQVLEELEKLDKREIPEAFDPSDIHNDIITTKETFYKRVAELKTELSELPEVKYYDDELTQLQERIEAVRDSIPEIPEIKYYDDDLENLLGLIEEVRRNIPELPEVRYYENEIAQLEEAIKNVEDRIPTVPEIRYYDDDVESLREQIKVVEGQIPEVPELPKIKYYDDEIEILSEDIDKIRDSLIDIKLAIIAVEKSVEDVEGKEIPEAFDPTGLQIEIEKAFEEIEKLKEQPVIAKEDIDPLLPLDQNFVTLDQLQQHYKLFINRIQQQLTSLGGGGETRLEFLDDVDRNTAKTDGYVLTYDSVLGKFKGAPAGSSVAVGAAGTWSVDSVGISTTKSVGIGTAADATLKLKVQGNSQIVGKLTTSDLYFDGSDFVEINAGISTLNITSSVITIGSTLQPSVDSVYDLGSPTRQWKELYLSGQTLYLAGVPISLSQNNQKTTIAIGNTTVVTQPEFNSLNQEVEFISSGIANVGYYDASAGQIVKLTEFGEQSGYYTVGQPLPNVGIITSHYFVVSNNGNNIGAGNTYIQTGVTTSYVGDWVAGIGTNQWGVLSFSSATIVPLSSNSNNLDGQSGSYYLDYNNFTNTPTIPTNNNQLTNGAGFVTFTNVSQLNNDSGYITAASTFSGNYNDLTNTPTIPTNNNQLTNGAGYVTSSGTVALSQGLTGTPNINVGIVTASAFFGDGSGLTGVVASGTGVVVQNNGSNVGTASTINFGSTLGATFANGTATINVSIPLSALTDVNTSNLTGISTDYIMVYDPSISGFKFVNPKTYFGINNDANSAPDIDDYGTY